MDQPTPDLTLDHYRDAIAICRATLRNDEDGILALAQSVDVVMTFQALVRLHLSGLLARADGQADIVDDFLARVLTQTTDLEELL